MFLDCERRNFVIQAYHRDLLEYMLPSASRTLPRVRTTTCCGQGRLSGLLQRRLPLTSEPEVTGKQARRRHQKVTTGILD
ncbi:hypothetical protein MLD38_000640 [Melastoma candidum]|uniref:Uncharacterized protein n=1 Tax=Melastoma candidum TaxID=119954 RepID=A0ACB9SJC4_9MYRT|nr:hypothetical protein MLD38_000640 [Melastoma candidum]